MLSAQRHPPAQPGTATRLSDNADRAATRSRPPLYIGQAAASRLVRDTDSVVDYFDDQLLARFSGDGDGAGLGMPDCVADPFPNHRFGMLGDGRRHQAVDGSRHPHRW